MQIQMQKKYMQIFIPIPILELHGWNRGLDICLCFLYATSLI